MPVLFLLGLVSTAEAQVDSGLYGLQQYLDGSWTAVGWVEVHDYTNGETVERHEHWYTNGSWDPNAPKIRFLYNQAAQGHANRPVSTITNHFGFRIVDGAPDTDGTDPGGSYGGCSGTKHLCPTFYEMENSVGTTVGYINLWDANGNAQEMYMLHPDNYFAPSSTVCESTWVLNPSSGPMTPPGAEAPYQLRKSGTATWTFKWAKRNDGASGAAGSTYVAPNSPPSCP